MTRLIRSYLLHYGYEDTLKSFDLASKSTVPPVRVAQENGFDEQDICYALNQRKTLRQLIRNGEIDAALNKIRDWFPQIVQVASEVPESVMKSQLLAFSCTIRGVFCWISIKMSQRDVVADTVNAMILSTNPNVKDRQGCLHSNLEKLLRQLISCCLERQSLNGDQGEAFQLHQVLNSDKKMKQADWFKLSGATLAIPLMTHNNTKFSWGVLYALVSFVTSQTFEMLIQPDAGSTASTWIKL
ncbi:hypothetical protein SLEP1_g43535 [Rubroshorea leprosula]|uniref:LisH domain-containing protein n=1 Tax=Rubroshorea leprosula TaxID=152421 RepID=A0AAV5LDM8_9ROSI|nr:hypothetical protein SLEP1_g43535 [Rubroshorea leprosula]